MCNSHSLLNCTVTFYHVLCIIGKCNQMVCFLLTRLGIEMLTHLKIVDYYFLYSFLHLESKVEHFHILFVPNVWVRSRSCVKLTVFLDSFNAVWHSSSEILDNIIEKGVGPGWVGQEGGKEKYFSHEQPLVQIEHNFAKFGQKLFSRLTL